MATALSTLYDDLLPDVPGLTPGNFALKALRDAARELCDRARIWVIDYTPVDLVAGTAVYTLTPGSGMEPVILSYVEVNGKPIGSTTEDALDAIKSEWRLDPDAAPQLYFQPDQARVQLHPAPDASATGGLVLRGSVKPSGSATTIDDALAINWDDAILAGAKARLYCSPKKPWTDHALSAKWQAIFDNYVGGADISRTKSFTRTPLRSTVVYR